MSVPKSILSTFVVGIKMVWIDDMPERPWTRTTCNDACFGDNDKREGAYRHTVLLDSGMVSQ